jgi:uncharacterized protein YggT (Ycf19 family)
VKKSQNFVSELPDFEKRISEHQINQTLRFFFRIINDFVHRFILNCTFIDFTVSLLILTFYIVDFNSEMVKSTEKP